MHRLLLKASAKKELDELPKKIRINIGAVIDELGRMGIHARHVKKLQPPVGGFRMRAGAYRLLFDRDKDIILIHHISKRADAY